MLSLLLAILSVSAHAQSQGAGEQAPYTFNQTEDGKISPMALDEDFSEVFNQIHQQKVMTTGLVVTGVVSNVSASAPLCSSGGVTPNINICAAIPGSDISGNISGNAANVTGVVAIANGGTGATTAGAALVNLGALAANQATNFLAVNGSNVMTGQLQVIGASATITGNGGLLVASSVTASAFFGYGGNLTIPGNFGWQRDVFTPNGSTKIFSLTQVPTDTTTVQVVLNNLTKAPNLDYTYSSGSNQITMSYAPATASRNFYALYSTGIVLGNGYAPYVGYSTQTAPSRAGSTVYRNLTGKPLQVTVTAGGNTIAGGGTLTAYTDASSSPSTVVDQMAVALAGFSLVYTIHVSFVVLSGNYYEVVPNSPVSISTWEEWN